MQTPNAKRGRGYSAAITVICAALAVAWTVGVAAAQAQPDPKTPTAKPPTAKVRTVAAPPAASQPARVGASTQRTPTSAPAARKKPGCGPKGVVVPTVNPDGPQPKWNCPEPQQTAEPIWKGKQIEFTFEVRNAGEGPLQILAKGG